jgi:hypothetical protein
LGFGGLKKHEVHHEMAIKVKNILLKLEIY